MPQHTGEVYRKAWPTSWASISYGLPYPAACNKHVTETFNASRVLIIASGTLARETDRLSQLQDALGSKVAHTRIGMRPHTLWSEVLQVTDTARRVNADLIVTLGAGSLTDGAKVVALALANGAATFDDLHALLDPKASLRAPTTPIISIPTSLSGGEYNHRGGASNDETDRKYSFTGPIRGPSLVILDPDLTTTTPDRWWLSTGVRAVDHCVETLCSLQSPESADADAANGLRLLAPGLLRCKANVHDLEARLACQMGVIDAMKPTCIAGVSMGASHGIGHQLGPLGVGHGETSCILLPAVCRFNASVNVARQDTVRQILWSDPLVAECFDGAGLTRQADLAALLDALFRALGMPRSLKDVGLGKIDAQLLDKLAENSLHDRCAPTNPIPLKEKGQVLEILDMV